MNTTQRNHVVLVDSKGEPTGTAEKMQAHQKGLLHLAFSVMLYREQGDEREYLLQQRARDKYHSGGLWTNTCCSHPMEDEPIIAAAKRRLYEELGIARPLNLVLGPAFEYRAELDSGLVEHEYDHVIACEVSHVDMIINPDEVEDCRWWTESELKGKMDTNPEQFTAWFSDVINRVDRMLV